MSENKSGKAGADTPAASPKVEVAQDNKVNTPQGDNQDDSQEIASLKGEVDKLKADVQGKDEDIASKDQEIASLKGEVDKLKKSLETLQTKIDKSKKGKAEKAEKRFIVISSFRGNTKADEGKIYDINDDVTDFDAERLDNLVKRELVKEV